jgi:D-glycero-alpha-D-manno-heptose 1-phosphate guanylyltransferase
MREAIILAGGLGTRLQQKVPGLPKSMAPINKKPFLEILLQSLSDKGFTRVILSLGYKSKLIFDHFGKSFKELELAYVFEDQPLGTGGGIRLAIEQCTSDHVFVMNGDTFLDFEVNEIEEFWKKNRLTIIVCKEISDASRYGKIIASDNLVKSFSEKGVAGPGLINAGCYIFGRHLLDNFPLNKKFSIESDFLSKEVSQTSISIYISKGFFIDIGVPDDFIRAQLELADKCQS